MNVIEVAEKLYHEKAVIMDESAIKRAITRISFEIIERNKGVENLHLVGLISRGFFIAKRISQKIEEVENISLPVGRLDITQYRDDVESIDDKTKDLSDIPFDIENRKIILVDDVLFTGRSTRAAFDALMERGRPKNIQLAALVDRGHRELPIRADYIGKNLPTSRDEIVKVLMKEKDGIDKVVILIKD